MVATGTGPSVGDGDSPYLRVVLFASDRAAHFRPGKDDSQWFNRRDALVRCVAALLFGPADGTGKGGVDVGSSCLRRRELVVLFDEDWTRLHMQHEPDGAATPMYPAERHVMGLWKRASERPGETLRAQSLSCRFVPYDAGGSHRLPTGMDDKRKILEHLQSVCDLEFLRRHRLNSPTAVVLKKTNKPALVEIWNEWQRSNSPKASKASSEGVPPDILESLLQPVSSDVKRVIAGTLHETSDHELPYWTESKATGLTQICLFLGAVRDMRAAENEALRRACRRCSVPHVGIRLGPVAEFTSKILTVVAFHHARGRLGPAVEALVARAPAKSSTDAEQGLTSTTLDVICLVPLASQEVVLDLEKRSFVLWNLVRCTVVTLWRSRLAGGTNHARNPLKSGMTVVFTDCVHIFLNAKDVETLAQAHQAAPCEHQVLKMIIQQIEKASSVLAADEKTLAKTLINELIDGKDLETTYAMDLLSAGREKQSQIVLGSNRSPGKHSIRNSALFGLVSLDGTPDGPCRRLERPFLGAFRKRHIPFVDVALQCGPCIDSAAASITLLQHFCYQGLLVPMILEAQSNDRIAEKHREKKRKQSS